MPLQPADTGVARDQTGTSERRILGRSVSGKNDLPCGLCGAVPHLTMAHVPPKCAGNDHLVYRRPLVVRNRIVQDERNPHGRLHVYGLCAGCNGLQAKDDDVYKQLQQKRSTHVPPPRWWWSVRTGWGPAQLHG